MENSEGNAVENQVLGWADLGMDAFEVAALVLVLFLLFRLYRNSSALLRVIRRMDRKIADTTFSGYRRKAELSEAGLQWTGDREQESDQPAAN